ncbi:hypothetical protein [Streptomyces pacificus]|uniref:Uncharacterized protein n=1 Tax=Streptomyces pacificus TaxID=2705029 RepID=A0A6A0APX5_9ACTN|nr:hypothetical protein [Streptomyces pacificus]GFH34291.1 hypothetical protein SCWH03_05050 [Streptomyces pacificus]
MSTPAVLPHRDGIVAALEAVNLVVGRGAAPDPVPASRMYAVVYMSPGRSVSESLADLRTNFDALFQVTAVGPDEERCLWVADRVRAGLHAGVTVEGRAVWRPEEIGGPPVIRDDDVSPPLFFLPIQFMIRSTS